MNVIRHFGDPKKATTLKGKQVNRREQLFVPEWNAFVPCAPYDDHFIYENPDRSPGSSSYMCTCGSPAVVVNPEREKRMFICLFHATYGSHTTSHVDLKDWPAVAGRVIEPKGDTRWL